MIRTEGTIIIQTTDQDLTPELIMGIEQTLNTEVERLIYKKHNVGIRVHLKFKTKGG